MAEMHEGERHFGQSNASGPERRPTRNRWNFAKNTVLPIAALGAAAMWTVVVARLTSPPDGGVMRGRQSKK